MRRYPLFLDLSTKVHLALWREKIRNLELPIPQWPGSILPQYHFPSLSKGFQSMPIGCPVSQSDVPLAYQDENQWKLLIEFGNRPEEMQISSKSSLFSRSGASIIFRRRKFSENGSNLHFVTFSILSQWRCFIAFNGFYWFIFWPIKFERFTDQLKPTFVRHQFQKWTTFGKVGNTLKYAFSLTHFIWVI